MKKSLVIIALVMFANTIFAAASNQSISLQFSNAISVPLKNVETEKNLTLKEKIALKKEIKKNADEPEISKGLYIRLPT
jgi:hypothetical protein